MLNAAYQLDISATASPSTLRVFIERLKQLMEGMPGWSVPTLDAQWRIKTATQIIENLSENKIAKTICSQVGTILMY